MKKYALFIGRWQTWHKGHEWLINQQLEKGKNVWVAIRDVFQNKDYSEEGRRKNITNAQTLAKFLQHKGYNVVVSLVSPYKDQRDKFKSEMGENLIEIYVHTSNERGREGFHVSNYEAPTEFYIDLDTTNEREIDTFKKLRKDLGI